jgi:hypothetical protein
LRVDGDLVEEFGYFRLADVHVSRLSRENARSEGALLRARTDLIRGSCCARMPLGGWSLRSLQNQTSICGLELRGAVTED